MDHRLGDSCLANSHNLSQALYNCELQWRRRRVEHRMCEKRNLFLGRRCTDGRDGGGLVIMWRECDFLGIKEGKWGKGSDGKADEVSCTT